MLRAYAQARSDRTVRRLAEAIQHLEEHGEKVTFPAIERVSGLQARTICRNPRARALFESHSAHHEAKRERERAERRRRRTTATGGDTGTAYPVAPARDPLLDRTKVQLVALVRSAFADRDGARQERDETQRRYAALLQGHMGCAQSIMKLEVKVARYEAHLGAFRERLCDQESR